MAVQMVCSHDMQDAHEFASLSSFRDFTVNSTFVLNSVKYKVQVVGQSCQEILPLPPASNISHIPFRGIKKQMKVCWLVHDLFALNLYLDYKCWLILTTY